MRTAASPPILPHLPIDRSSGTPLYHQIADALRRAILDGLIRPGQRVPSTRDLAEQLEVSRLPVLTAYEQLLHEGYLRGRSGSGTFVSEALPDDLLRPTPRERGMRPHREARHDDPRARFEGGLGPFRMNLPGLDHFPQAVWSRIVARHAHRMTPTMMAYGDPAGLPALRSAIAEYLRTARAVRCRGQDVIVLSGSQAALRVCAGVLFSRGDAVAVEDPGYPGAHGAFRADGADIVPIPVDEEGLDVAALARARKRIRAVYITPSHQYPLGMSMSVARRLALIEWAERRGAWIIEDDYDSEYRYVSRPLAALQGMSPSARVVYIGTFSKVLFPSIRLGYVVAPRPIQDALVRARDALDVFSPTLYQLALADFIREGHFTRHLRKMRIIYHSRRDAMLEGLERHCSGLLEVRNADAGLHLAAVLANGLRDADVIRAMAERELRGFPLSPTYLGSRAKQGLLLGFGGSDESQIATATKTLGKVLQASARAR
jgi:GntR family transcriptional regulator/MocR family aminotransferase